MRGAPVLLVLLAACGHGDAWDFTTAPLTEPLTAGVVTQLTFNVGDDLDPAWFPDGSSFVYTTERRDRDDRDRCLAIMAVNGGTIRSVYCQRAGVSDDSMDVMQVAAPGPDGRVAFLYSTFDLFRFTGYVSRQLVVAGLDSPLVRDARRARYPLRPAGGFTHDGIAEIAWRSPTELVYLATLPHFPQPCKFCRPDTATPVQIVTADLTGDTAVVTAVPNTVYATSFALQAGDTLYFTLLGDTRVFRHVLSTGAEALVHDFSLVGIARDVQVVGARLLVIVGGDVTIEYLPGMGLVQHDDGGAIHLLALDTGVETVVGTGLRRFRRSALSPDGRVLLAESRDDPADDWDIWRVGLP